MNSNNTQALRQRVREHLRSDESALIRSLASDSGINELTRRQISERAENLVIHVRESSDPVLMESFLTQYGLTTSEGIALMCLAEALLRVPDSETMDALIHDKIAPADWGKHLGQSSSSLVNASTWALLLTGNLIADEPDGIVGSLRGLVKRLGEPVIRTAVHQAIKELGNQFVLGEGIDAALKNSEKALNNGYTYSYDMLGEAALTDADAKRYHLSYSRAISILAKSCIAATVAENPGISVKLSALYPRYEVAQRDQVMVELVARTRSLAMLAKSANMGFNIDAEEADRLDLSLDVIEAVLSEPSLAGWKGFGIVVQAYSRRAPFVLDWLHDMAKRLDRHIMVRLVKGAYWDSEIKQSQVEGLDGFPVYTRKSNTDIAYVCCAKKLLGMTDRIYPQFATHNAHSVAAVMHLAEELDIDHQSQYEFQRLHGMGEALHKIVHDKQHTRCRIYAPVGAHEDLLAYLVRRLLENGANSSFVNQLVDESIAPSEIATDPFLVLDELDDLSHPVITKPENIYKPLRVNSKGFDLSDTTTLATIYAESASFRTHQWTATPILENSPSNGVTRSICNPSNLNDIVGHCTDATIPDVDKAFANAEIVFSQWSQSDTKSRANYLRLTADLYEQHSAEFIALTCREAGKTLKDSIAEIREAVDFLRYYADQAEDLFRRETVNARGTFVCISPWNFPLAIFSGQIAAALATGNCVIAKPSEQTPLVACRAIELFHLAGIPKAALQLLPGDGVTIGAALVSNNKLAGVCFTGSTGTAQLINKSMAQHCSPDAPLIAETGGLNAMIVDSTALPEQAVKDIIESAFQSAGQRCSALRVLYVQEDIKDRVIDMLSGAMLELNIGNAEILSTDVGPVIDQLAKDTINRHCNLLENQNKLIYRCELKTDNTEQGYFVAPAAYYIDGINELESEVFGPVLHVVSFAAKDFYNVIKDINNSGYGLTFGFHTRVDERVQDVLELVDAGNIYINRNQIGAVVGSQPFGGKKLSGTGPKAGGPHYLLRFIKYPVVTSLQTISKNPTTNLISFNKLKSALESLEPLLTKRSSSTASSSTILATDPTIVKEALIKDSSNIISTQSTLTRLLDTISLHYHETIELPGATGESNRLGMDEAGIFLCIDNGDSEHWFAQIISCLVLGNAVIAIGDDVVGKCQALNEILRPLLAQLQISKANKNPDSENQDREIENGQDPEHNKAQKQAHNDGRNELPLIAINGELSTTILDQLMAFSTNSNHPVTGVCVSGSMKEAKEIRQLLAQLSGPIVPLITSAFDISPLISEKSFCIDTTAAGGNASLLAQAV